MKIQTASSLDKIFPDGEVSIPEKNGVMLKNERYNFQVIAREEQFCQIYGTRLVVTGDIADSVTIRAVDCVPAILTMYVDSDDYVIFPKGSDSGVYPDILSESATADIPQNKNVAFWITVFDENGLPVGKHKLKIELRGENGDALAETEYEIEVLDAVLPKSDFAVTQWMHYDAIANYYNLKPWSDEYYEKLGSFLDTYVVHGGNMLYVPLFTPPLDTKIGGERLDVQLADVTYRDGKYGFDFAKLEKFLDFAIAHGIKYFEMCHLATQWGAAHCPKICANTRNGYECIFGWDTSSTGENYVEFLRECLTGVNTILESKGVVGRTYFHISDEPNKDNIARYKEVYDAVKPIISKYKLMDAVSDSGRDIIDVPVVSTTHLGGKCAENEFVYYCCSNRRNNLSNRFLNMPSVRNRIFGMQLWLNEAKGFLHWGFNFYNTALSVRDVNPFCETDGNGHFPAGDPFVVYPGRRGALDSLRLEVFYAALQDRTVLEELEKKIGRKRIEKLLSNDGIVGWTEYPHSATAVIETATKIRRMLAGTEV